MTDGLSMVQLGTTCTGTGEEGVNVRCGLKVSLLVLPFSKLLKERCTQGEAERDAHFL